MASLVALHTQALMLHAAGTLDRQMRGRTGQNLILTYHRVIADDDVAMEVPPGMYVRASTFDRHLRWLETHFEVRDLDVVVNQSRAQPGRHLAAITFDDGWRDNLSVAWPILKRYDMPATVFLVSSWVDEAAREPNGFLTPHEVRCLTEEGMKFGAHTNTHPSLPGLDDDEVTREMARSKEATSDWSGRRCTYFAYPFGHEDGRIHALARSHFEASVVLDGRWWCPSGDRARVSRVALHQDVSSNEKLLAARALGMF